MENWVITTDTQDGLGWWRARRIEPAAAAPALPSRAGHPGFQSQSDLLHLRRLRRFFTLHCGTGNTSVWSGNHKSFLSVSLCT